MKSFTKNRGTINTELIITLLVVCVLLGIAFAKFSGISLTTGLLSGLMVGLGILAILALIVRVGAIADNNASKTASQTKSEIEKAFPNTRAKHLTNGKWLLSCKKTGMAIDEIEWSA